MMKELIKETDIFSMLALFKKEASLNKKTVVEIYKDLAAETGLFAEWRIKSNKVKIYVDQDGHKNLVFCSKYDLDDNGDFSISYLKRLNDFYNNFYGSGEMCKETSFYFCKHKSVECVAEVAGEDEDIKVSHLTVASFFMTATACNDLMVMRYLCQWLYSI